MRSQLLRLTLRTPLHPTVSRRFMLLTATDDKPLDPSVPLRYATHQFTDADTETETETETETDTSMDTEIGPAHIVLAKAAAEWGRRLSAEEPTPVHVRFKGADTSMTARLAAGEVLDQAVLRFLQKYPGEWTELGVGAQATPEDMQQAAQGVAVVLFHSTS